MITKIPLDAIKVADSVTQRGYILYDRVQSKLVVSTESDTTNAIKRSGDTILQKISYKTEGENISPEIAEPVNPEQLVHSAYVDYQINLLRESWEDYLQVSGGQMTGPILLAGTSTDSDAVITKGQVDDKMSDTNFIAKEGGTMKDALHLHSTSADDYETFHAVPKFYVDQKIEEARIQFTDTFSADYLSLTGGTMTGTLYQDPPSHPYEDNHIMTMDYVKEFVQEYVNGTDWSCTNTAGSIGRSL